MWRIERKDCESSHNFEIYGYALSKAGAKRLIKKAPKESSCGFYDFYYSKHRVKFGALLGD